MIITTNENNPNALKLVLAAKLAQQSFNINIVLPKDVSQGGLPSLDLPTGSSLFSTNAAVLFLVPAVEESSVWFDKWLEWDVSQLQPALVAYGGSGKLDISHKPRIWSLLKELNTSLNNKKYLIESTTDLSVADATVWVSLWSTIIATDVNTEISKEFPHVQEWLKNIELLPIVQESLKEFEVDRGMKAIASIQAASWFPLNSYTGGASSKSLPNENILAKEKEVISITKDEIQSISESWASGSYPVLKESPYPVLPKKGERNILITSALPYVNNVPHLGNIIGCVLSADIFARYCRQRNYNTLYVCGTDEYGTATEAKAFEEKTTPQAICDKYFSIHNDIYRWFNIGFDIFGRSSTPEQTEIVQSLFLALKEKGFILHESIDQLLCENCNKFLADRFVEGTCPRCAYVDARGDQCDKCGHLSNSTELINPRCKMCNSSPIVKPSIQFFLDLPQLEPMLRKWAASVESEWSATARAVAKPWLRDGLKKRCITRDLKWGIPVPLKGYEDKVFYVWFDAPVGYVSITKRYTKEWEQWWKPKDDNVSLYQFMAKDNVPFHAVMFPASLLASGQGYMAVKHIMATEYLNYEDTKFSKSRGTGVFGTDARDTGIAADVWRFYLAYIRPESQDSNFNWVDLATKNNSELLNNLGNFVNRSLMFAVNSFDSKVPPMDLQEDDLTVLALAQRELTSYVASLEKGKMRDALRHILAISKHGNQYMQSQEPWVKIKGTDDDKKKAGTVIGVCCNLAHLLSVLLGPYVPNTARGLRAQLGLDTTNYGYIPDVITNFLPAGHKIGKPTPLFSKIEDQQIELLRKKFAGKQDSPPREAEPVAAVVPDKSVPDLEAAVAKQALLVRELKAKGDKTVWQPQVVILLQLKKQLAELQADTTTKNEATSPNLNKSSATSVPEKNAKNAAGKDRLSSVPGNTVSSSTDKKSRKKK